VRRTIRKRGGTGGPARSRCPEAIPEAAVDTAGSSNSPDTKSNFVLFDTSVFIDHLCTGRQQQRIAATTGLVRNSAVVLAALGRGAAKPADETQVRSRAPRYLESRVLRINRKLSKTTTRDLTRLAPGVQRPLDDQMLTECDRQHEPKSE
jgi:predicted nucleic acid-binding protein